MPSGITVSELKMKYIPNDAERKLFSKEIRDWEIG